MTPGDNQLLLVVLLLISLAALTVWIVQFFRGRRGRGDGHGPWWEGPWDEDDKDSSGR
ncbi:hypothetical protein [Microbacterium capsulatum]|uniref:Uncharacterized protein n=1 Tax=Microbacterium capsulatum TaxID=3041921 RepID=A0ABU0XGX6_9MICO|nr:hypothetical protein [Microbacterium sp. ASV81]MDQ4213420.1 hypothetical protein [Microbacterium sp. ASV81]